MGWDFQKTLLGPAGVSVLGTPVVSGLGTAVVSGLGAQASPPAYLADRVTGILSQAV